MWIESRLILSALDRRRAKVDCKWIVSGLGQSTSGRWIEVDRCGLGRNYRWARRPSRDIISSPRGVIHCNGYVGALERGGNQSFA